MADRWTEDVELAGRVIAAHRIDCDPSAPCIVCSESAQAVLAALADAGRLLPPGAIEQWGVRDEYGVDWPHTEEGALAHAKARTRYGNVSNSEAVHRWVGPWLPVQPEEKPHA